MKNKFLTTLPLSNVTIMCFKEVTTWKSLKRTSNHTVSSSVLSGQSTDAVTPGSSWLRDIMGHLPSYLSPVIFILLSLLLLSQPCTSYRPQVVQRSSTSPQPQSSGNDTGKRTCADKVVCRPGIMLPVWLPLNPPVGEQAGRAVIYFSCLLYMFLGVSIVADRFMGAIEVITSQVQMSYFTLCLALKNSVFRFTVYSCWVGDCD